MAKPKTLADRIRFARKVRNNMGSRQLDRAADLKPGHTAVIESRGDAAIESSTATKIANALHVSLDWLLTGKGDGPSADSDAGDARSGGLPGRFRGPSGRVAVPSSR